jgi:type I restriction enzyme R subunit
LDEVHRTQYGKLALKMKNILQNAFFFGFTGTPISKTYKEFGYIFKDIYEKEFYLDKYFIDDAERDGFVVPIVCEIRKEKISLKDEDLEWYLEQIDVEDIGEEAEISQLKAEVRKRIDEIKVILENPKEIDKVCEDLSKHFKENFDGKFKGLIVTGSRKACVRYKKILDEKYLPPEYTEVVMTFNQNDEEEIQQYKRKLLEKFDTNDTHKIVEQIIDKFRKEEYPKLLIVTDMLITGFDEPKLGVLYLHKLLKNHRLLQTIARVNRPYFEKKAGLIVDYVGIFKFIEKAFKVYLAEDVKVIKKAIKEKKDTFEEFVKILNELKKLFGDLVGKFEKEIFDKVLEILKNEEVENRFTNLYRNLRNWYEFLATDKRMIKYLTDYKWFSVVYEYYKKLKRPDIPPEKLEKYFQKTIELIHELTEISEFSKKAGPTVVDLNYIKSLKESNLTEEQKTIGSVYALRYICTLHQKNPVYKSIAERVKEIIRKWEENEIDIIALGSEVEEILNYIEEKEKEKTTTNLNEIEFGIKLALENNKKINKEDVEKVAKQIYERIKNNLFPDWNKNPAISKEVSKKIREYLTEIRQIYGLNYEEFNKLHQEIFDFIVNL